MARKLLRTVATGLILAVVLSLIRSGAMPTLAQPPTPSRDKIGGRTVSGSNWALSRIGPTLRSLAREGSEELIWINVFVKEGTDLSRYMEPGAVTRKILGQTQILGQARAANLVKVASHEGVTAVLDPMPYEPPSPIIDPDVSQKRDGAPEKIRKRVAAIRAAGEAADRNMLADSGTAGAAAAERTAPTGWWDVGNGHKSAVAWDKGFTGQGVKVADLDSGVDFAHPDLQGTWAVLDDPESPYDGWPIAFDPYSIWRYAFWGAEYGPDVMGLTWYADTSTTCTGSPCAFQPRGAIEPHDYTLPATSKSGVYHIGYHPDTALETWWYGERVAVLVVDEHTAGVYDTVYVDLDADYDFTDEKPATQADPISWKDNWDSAAGRPGSDGYADLSGGMIYYISDGTNYVPGFDWLWLPFLSSPPPVPGPGDMVAFMINDALRSGGDHGTLVASAIAGQGVINGGAPPWKPPATEVGGIDQGGGRDAKIIAIGDFYRSGSPDTDSYYFTTLGYDGEPGTGDEADIVNMSYGSSGVDNDGWDFESRFQAWLNETAAPTLSWVASTGNGAPGYGTVTPPSAFTGMDIGASTQYGSTGTFDSISTVDQINWGDVMSWSNTGPGTMGSASVSVIANGAWGAGALSLNEWGDGWTAWDSWGGTSRSAPIAAGNLALVYDAYKQANGQFPTYQVARELLKSGATDVGYNPIRQGAGLLNADRATDIAAGLYGVRVSPSEWNVGDYRGAEYPGFARILQPGSSDTQTFTVYNPSSVDITVGLSDAYVVQMGDPIEWTHASKNQSREDGAFTKPDYLWDLTDQIPAGADLMEVKLLHLYEEFTPGAPDSGTAGADSGTAGADSSHEWDNMWRVAIYDWMDVNGDGDLWTDDNGDGIVNWDEIDEGEYIRFTYGYNYGNAKQAVVHNPADRTHDGLFVGVRHQDRTSRVPSTWLRFRATFYERAHWPWLTAVPESAPADAGMLTIPAGSSATFDATVTVPADARPGFYEGFILVQDPGDASHSPHTSAVPVTVNVAASGADFSLGGAVEETPYDNGHLFGFFTWKWRAESGDWRFFFTDVPDDHGLPERTRWLVHTTWDTLPTDVDTLIMGPTSDDFSDPGGSFYVPNTYGPYTLETVGGSENRYMGSGKWQFHTTSGATDDWVTAPLDAGLHLFALHNVLFSGKEMEESFKVDVGTISATPTEVTVDDAPVAGMETLTILSSLDLPDFTVDAFGLGKSDEFRGLPVIQDDPFDPSTSSYLFQYTVRHGGLIDASIHSVASDVDLFLLYDADADGVFDFNTEVIATSDTPTGDEHVRVTLPPDGEYLVAVHGWAAAGDTVDVMIKVIQGQDLAIWGAPRGPISSGTPFNIIVNWNGLTPGVWQGVIALGPVDGPTALWIPVTLTRLGQEAAIAAAPVGTGYVKSSELLTNRFGGVEMRTGVGSGSREKYHGAFQIDLSSLPAEAEILTAQVELTGASDRYMSDFATGTWWLSLLDSSIDVGWSGLGYWQIAGAAVEEAIGAAETDADLGVGTVNTFAFSEGQIAALQARLETTGKASFRVDYTVVPRNTRHLFAWDGGSGGAAPVLRVTYLKP